MTRFNYTLAEVYKKAITLQSRGDDYRLAVHSPPPTAQEFLWAPTKVGQKTAYASSVTMEGYIYERRPRDSTKGLFSSGKVFKKRWCVLQGQTLTMYDDIDLKTQKPKGLVKSHTKIVNKVARVRTTVAGDEPFCFEIVPIGTLAQVDTSTTESMDNREFLILAAESEESLAMWINALNEASRGDNLVMTLVQQCHLLGLPSPQEKFPTDAEVTHAYRKAVVKHHPDKPGGNERMFRVVQKACQVILKEIERANSFDKIEFSVIVEKTEAAGIGLRVVEDEESGEIIVSGIHPKVKILHLDDSAGGSLIDGDILIGIGVEHTVSWKFARVRQRLNDFREPVASLINLNFRRFVQRENYDDVEHISPSDVAVDITLNSPAVPKSALKSALKGSDTTASKGPIPADFSPAGRRSSLTAPLVPSAASQSSTAPIVLGAGSMGSPNMGELALSLSPIAGGGMQQPTGTMLAMQQEIAEMRKQLSASEKALTTERAKNEVLTAALKSIGEEVQSRQEAMLLAKQGEGFYKLQVQEMLVASFHQFNSSDNSNQDSSSSAELDLINKGIAGVVEKMMNNRSIHASEQTEAYLKKEDLASAQVQANTYQNAQRLAVVATSALDPSGSVLQMWQASGVSATERLLRLERRMQKSEAQLGMPTTSAGYVLPENKVHGVHHDPNHVHVSLFANKGTGSGAGGGIVGVSSLTQAQTSGSTSTSLVSANKNPPQRKHSIIAPLGFQHHNVGHANIPGHLDAAVVRRPSSKF